jgi:hypothetical protein
MVTFRPMGDGDIEAEDPQVTPKRKSTGRIDLGDLATNRILYALALLGVLLPSNAILSHFSRIGFTYTMRRWAWTPAFTWHVHAVSFIYAMEGFLAVAVYLYGWDFLFRSRLRFFHFIATFFYGATLIVPPVYILCYGYANLTDLALGLHGFLYYAIQTVGNVLLGILIVAAQWAVVSRLESSD